MSAELVEQLAYPWDLLSPGGSLRTKKVDDNNSGNDNNDGIEDNNVPWDLLSPGGSLRQPAAQAVADSADAQDVADSADGGATSNREQVRISIVKKVVRRGSSTRSPRAICIFVSSFHLPSLKLGTQLRFPNGGSPIILRVVGRGSDEDDNNNNNNNSTHIPVRCVVESSTKTTVCVGDEVHS